MALYPKLIVINAYKMKFTINMTPSSYCLTFQSLFLAKEGPLSIFSWSNYLSRVSNLIAQILRFWTLFNFCSFLLISFKLVWEHVCQLLLRSIFHYSMIFFFGFYVSVCLSSINENQTSSRVSILWISQNCAKCSN